MHYNVFIWPLLRGLVFATRKSNDFDLIFILLIKAALDNIIKL